MARGKAPPGVKTTVKPVPVPRDAAAANPWARPFFAEGELEAFAFRPTTRRDFVGVGTGVSALPGSANTALNSFYLLVEPQVELSGTNWRLSSGIPLQFELLDTRGPFETCLERARGARGRGLDQDDVMAETGVCLIDQSEKTSENSGRLRKEDWDEASDFARIIRHFSVGGPQEKFYLRLSRLYDQTLGHGTTIRDYNANIDYNTARLGATMDINREVAGAQFMINDVINPDVLGVLAFIRPFRESAEDVLLRSLSFGLSFTTGIGQPNAMLYEPGLFEPSIDQPIPKVDSSLNFEAGDARALYIVGADVEVKVVRTQHADLKLYFDYSRILGHGGGFTLGSLLRTSAGAPPRQAFRARAEVHYFDANYLPSYFDSFHDIFQFQYLPAGYTGTNGVPYHPTKLAYLRAAAGGPKRIGGYLELTHSIFNVLTLGLSVRGWGPVGSPGNPVFTGLAFPDYSKDCALSAEGRIDCGSRNVPVPDQGFGAVRLRAELPFRRFLQAFAYYEMFTTTTEPGFNLFSLDGDNEVLFTGARMMLLPVLFVQAEARRYFFLQRLSNVNLTKLTIEQDQNFHANWTFALSAYLGYEFD